MDSHDSSAELGSTVVRVDTKAEGISQPLVEVAVSDQNNNSSREDSSESSTSEIGNVILSMT